MPRLIVLLLTACDNTLPLPYVITDLRVLALVMEPPDARDGEPFTLTTYFAGAAATPAVSVGRCEDGGYTCDAPIVLDIGSASEVEPGLFAFTSSLIAAGDTYLVHGDDGVHPIDALKRLNPGAGNANPVIDGITFLTLEGAVATTLSPHVTYRALPLFKPEVSQQPYTRTYYDGRQESAQEEAIFTWSCDACTIENPLTYGFQTSRITPTTIPFRLYLVLRDGRGGETLKLGTGTTFPSDIATD